LLTDTVGFIRKLPHHLVASFRSTLEEVKDADMLLHVVDLSNPSYLDQMATVENVLTELGVDVSAAVVVFNKVDLIEDETILNYARERYPQSVFIAAGRKIGLDKLESALIEFMERAYVEDEISFHAGDGKMYSTIRHLAEVIEENYDGNNIILKYRSRKENSEKIKKFAGEQLERQKLS